MHDGTCTIVLVNSFRVYDVKGVRDICFAQLCIFILFQSQSLFPCVGITMYCKDKTFGRPSYLCNIYLCNIHIYYFCKIYISHDDVIKWKHLLALCALLVLCAGNSPVTGEIPSQRPVTRSLDVFFDMCLKKHLSKQSWGRWFETQSRSWWRHCNEG